MKNLPLVAFAMLFSMSPGAAASCNNAVAVMFNSDNYYISDLPDLFDDAGKNKKSGTQPTLDKMSEILTNIANSKDMFIHQNDAHRELHKLPGTHERKKIRVYITPSTSIDAQSSSSNTIIITQGAIYAIYNAAINRSRRPRRAIFDIINSIRTNNCENIINESSIVDIFTDFSYINNFIRMSLYFIIMHEAAHIYEHFNPDRKLSCAQMRDAEIQADHTAITALLRIIAYEAANGGYLIAMSNPSDILEQYVALFSGTQAAFPAATSSERCQPYSTRERIVLNRKKVGQEFINYNKFLSAIYAQCMQTEYKTQCISNKSRSPKAPQ